VAFVKERFPRLGRRQYFIKLLRMQMLYSVLLALVLLISANIDSPLVGRILFGGVIVLAIVTNLVFSFQRAKDISPSPFVFWIYVVHQMIAWLIVGIYPPIGAVVALSALWILAMPSYETNSAK